MTDPGKCTPGYVLLFTEAWARPAQTLGQRYKQGDALAGEALFPSQGRSLLWSAYTLHLFDSVCIVNIVFQNALEAPLWLVPGLCGLMVEGNGKDSGREFTGESRRGEREKTEVKKKEEREKRKEGGGKAKEKGEGER